MNSTVNNAFIQGAFGFYIKKIASIFLFFTGLSDNIANKLTLSHAVIAEWHAVLFQQTKMHVLFSTADHFLSPP
jgi:hypothetical protein